LAVRSRGKRRGPAQFHKLLVGRREFRDMLAVHVWRPARFTTARNRLALVPRPFLRRADDAQASEAVAARSRLSAECSRPGNRPRIGRAASVSDVKRHRLYREKIQVVIWLIGLAGAGKTSVGRALYERVKSLEQATVFLDGDHVAKSWVRISATA